MCSNASTSKGLGRLAAWAAFALVLGGCAGGVHRPTGPAPLHGYADLDALVRRHPGWGGVAQYDEALARLAEAARRAAPSAPSDSSLAALPAAAEGALIAPPLALRESRRRLEAAASAQITHLRRRQAQNRTRQVALKRTQWEADAATEYVRAAAAAQSAYAQQLRLLAGDRDARRLNLTLQIRALRRIVSGWDKSQPPTPELNRARTDLQEKQDQLAGLETTRRQSEAQALTDRDASLRGAAQVRDKTVSTLVSGEVARLSAQDDRQAAALEEQLGAQRDALLRQERLLAFAAVPPAGGLGAQRLPNGPALATTARGAGHSFRLATVQLQAQRKRWVDFLYSDTRAAAQDAATQKHWVVTYGRPVSGERDLTAPLAQALTARVWKT